MLVPSHRGQTWGEGTLLRVTSPPSIPTLMGGGHASSASPTSSLTSHWGPRPMGGARSRADHGHAHQDYLTAPSAAVRHWGDRTTDAVLTPPRMPARSEAQGLDPLARASLTANTSPSTIQGGRRSPSRIGLGLVAPPGARAGMDNSSLDPFLAASRGQQQGAASRPDPPSTVTALAVEQHRAGYPRAHTHGAASSRTA